MWIKKDGKDVWKTDRQALEEKTKEQLIEMILDLSAEIDSLQDNQP